MTRVSLNTCAERDPAACRYCGAIPESPKLRGAEAAEYDPLELAHERILAFAPGEPGSDEAMRDIVGLLCDAIRERCDPPSSVGFVTRADIVAAMRKIGTMGDLFSPEVLNGFRWIADELNGESMSSGPTKPEVVDGEVTRVVEAAVSLLNELPKSQGWSAAEVNLSVALHDYAKSLEKR
jgi:hypothetical protein